MCRGKAYTIKLGFVHCPLCFPVHRVQLQQSWQGHRPLPVCLPSTLHCTALQYDFASRVWAFGLTICLQMIPAVRSVQTAVCSGVTMCLGIRIRPLTLQVWLRHICPSRPCRCLVCKRSTFVCFIRCVPAVKMFASHFIPCFLQPFHFRYYLLKVLPVFCNLIKGCFH